MKRIFIPCIIIVTCFATFASADIIWTENVIDSTIDGPWDVFVIDLDEDDDFVVVACGHKDGTLIWYDNNGSETFTRKVIDTLPEDSGPVEVYAGDGNSGYGGVDIIVSEYYGDRISVYSNDGSENFTRYVLINNYDGAKCAIFSDIDNDNCNDIVGCAFHEAETQYDKGDVSWWWNDGDSIPTCTRFQIDDTIYGAHDVEVADLNDDDSVDVVASAYKDHDVLVYWQGTENEFTEDTIDYNLRGAWNVHLEDIDGNNTGGIDILATGYNCSTLVWYMNGQNTKNVIDNNIQHPLDAVAADFDNDGDMDIVADGGLNDFVSPPPYGAICWYENDGSENFTRHTIVDTLRPRVGDIFAEDIDEDGRIDIAVALGGDDKVSWWRNTYTNGKIANPDIMIPAESFLLDSYPNPFNSITTISFNIPCSGNTVLELYNLMGQKVEILVDDWMSAGNHIIQWDAEGYSSGIYFYKLTAGDKTITKRMTLMK